MIFHTCKANIWYLNNNYVHCPIEDRIGVMYDTVDTVHYKLNQILCNNKCVIPASENLTFSSGLKSLVTFRQDLRNSLTWKLLPKSTFLLDSFPKNSDETGFLGRHIFTEMWEFHNNFQTLHLARLLQSFQHEHLQSSHLPPKFPTRSIFNIQYSVSATNSGFSELYFLVIKYDLNI